MTNIQRDPINASLKGDPLIDAMIIEAFVDVLVFGQPLSAPMALWTFWKSRLPDLTIWLFDEWSCHDVFTQPEPFGLLLMDNDWWKDLGWELDILDRVHHVLPLRSIQVAMCKLGYKPSLPKNSVNPGLQKIARLVDTIESETKGGHPEAILIACEVFAKYRGQWLKVAGMEKGEIIESGMAMRVLQHHEMLLEFGAFVGYTAVRCSNAVGKLHRNGPSVISLEVSPLHVCVASHMLDIGQLAHIAEVKSGQAKDLLPLVKEEFGCRAVGFSFMDHRGTIFHKDFAWLQKHLLFAKRARFVTDNTLNPGAPVFLWERILQRAHEGANATVAWAITEFLSDHEDWTAVTDHDSPALQTAGCLPDFWHVETGGI